MRRLNLHALRTRCNILRLQHASTLRLRLRLRGMSRIARSPSRSGVSSMADDGSAPPLATANSAGSPRHKRSGLHLNHDSGSNTRESYTSLTRGSGGSASIARHSDPPQFLKRDSGASLTPHARFAADIEDPSEIGPHSSSRPVSEADGSVVDMSIIGGNSAYGSNSALHMAAGGSGLPPSCLASAVSRGLHKTKSQKRAEKALVKEHALRLWLRVDPRGDVVPIQADKNKIAHQLGIQQRDMRILEPQMAGTYPSGILDRDNAIVVNLEFIKCIITRDCVYVVNPDEGQIPGFVAELKNKLAATLTPGDRKRSEPSMAGFLGPGGPAPVGMSSNTNAFNTNYLVELPFELKALEVCLDTVAFHLDSLTSDLESSAYPALDGLLEQISSSKYLQRVRRVKNAMVRLVTRVQTIRQLLEKLLADDKDMHHLNLTANALEDAKEAAAAAQQMADSDDMDDVSSISSVSTTEEEAAIAQVEMLLEAYFMHLDNTYNRLQTLGEYIKDTEDLVNTQLDQHRNRLITVDLYLTAIMCSASAMTVVAGFFGTNLNSQVQEYPNLFTLICVVTTTLCVTALIAFVAWTVRAGIVML